MWVEGEKRYMQRRGRERGEREERGRREGGEREGGNYVRPTLARVVQTVKSW